MRLRARPNCIESWTVMSTVLSFTPENVRSHIGRGRRSRCSATPGGLISTPGMPRTTEAGSTIECRRMHIS